MRRILRLAVAITSVCLAITMPTQLQSEPIASSEETLLDMPSIHYAYPLSTLKIDDIKVMLSTKAKTLSQGVVQKVLTTIECAGYYHIDYNPILTVIDYSLPSSAKRLWIFNLKTKQLLFHTYVSHGIKSGSLLTTFFSNKYDSKSSSMGIYLTEQAYRGREGMSLRLSGLDRGFNDNASNRAIVMHGGWYMDDDFIKKYGRAGRSWGCPAVPLSLSDSIINTIKNNSLLIVYYPNESWFEKSKFLNCRAIPSLTRTESYPKDIQNNVSHELRDSVLFANVKIKSAETDPVLTMPAQRYEQTFHTKAPLTRMLRRQINDMEYIALSSAECQKLITDAMQNNNTSLFNDLYFVVPHVKMDRGYYVTEMKIVNLGKVKDIKFKSNSNTSTTPPSGFTLYFDDKSPITLRSSDQFIRWLGL